MTSDAAGVQAPDITIKRSYADGRSVTTTICGDAAEDVISTPSCVEGCGASILAKAPRRLTEAERALRDQHAADQPPVSDPR